MGLERKYGKTITETNNESVVMIKSKNNNGFLQKFVFSTNTFIIYKW